MTLVLIQKELRRNWPTFLMLGLFTWLVVFTIAYRVNADGTGGGAFPGVGWGLLYMMPISGIILGHVLISSEYQAKTQLFLEGLPLPKWRMITWKLVLGFFLACLYAVGSVLIGWLLAMGSEPVTGRFLGVLLTSACGWAMFSAGFFFVTGFLGRYRIIIYLTLAITLLLVINSTIPISDFPPYALIANSRFGFEREVWPFFDLKITAAIIIGWIAIAYLLGLAKEGSISSMLGEKMSYREKMFIGGAFGIGLMTLSPFLFEEPKGEPFAIPGAIEEDWEGVTVTISPEELNKPVDLEISIAAKLARRLAQARDWLGIPEADFPRVFVVEKSDIEEVERIDWDDVEGDNVVLMYAGYRQPEFTEGRLLSWTMSQVLRKNSKDRVTHEDRWWIVCGLEGLWEMEEAEPETIAEREQMAVEAVQKEGLTIESLEGWSLYQDDVEWRSADAVAWMGMRLLQKEKGREVVQKLAKATVTKPFTRKDARAVVWDYRNPVKPAFEAATGESLESFVEKWRNYILSFSKETEEEESE